MPFFIHDVAYGIKSPIDIAKISDRLTAPDALKKTRPTTEEISPNDPQVQRDLLFNRASTQEKPGSGYRKSEAGATTDELMAEHIMSSPVVFSNVNNPIEDMIRLMDEHEIHHLVLTDNEKVAIGTVQYSQLLKPVSELRQILTPILSTTINTPLSHIAYALLQSGRDAILVSEDEEIVGIITTKNFLRLFAKSISFQATV